MGGEFTLMMEHDQFFGTIHKPLFTDYQKDRFFIPGKNPSISAVGGVFKVISIHQHTPICGFSSYINFDWC